jgi:hypothetical protein
LPTIPSSWRIIVGDTMRLSLLGFALKNTLILYFIIGPGVKEKMTELITEIADRGRGIADRPSPRNNHRRAGRNRREF